MSSNEWYAVYCRAKSEFLAEQQLMAQGFSVYLPRYKKLVHHARSMCEVCAPLFPRYLFVTFDVLLHQWRKINSTRGVVGLVSVAGGRLQPVQAQVISELQNLEDEEGMVSLSALELFRQGDEVRILEGAFEGCVGVYQKMSDKQRVELLLNFLNNDVRMQVPAYAVERIAR